MGKLLIEPHTMLMIVQTALTNASTPKDPSRAQGFQQEERRTAFYTSKNEDPIFL
jgi:hypothetical protein